MPRSLPWLLLATLTASPDVIGQVVGGRWEPWTTGYGMDRWHEGYGSSLLTIGDFDGDGHDDFLVGSPIADTNTVDSGAMTLFSGRTGLALWEHDGFVNSADFFATSLALVADLDNDLVPEVLVGATGTDATLGIRDCGAIHLLSGATLFQIDRIRGDLNEGHFGHAVADAGDLDGDGYHDLIAGAPDAAFAGLAFSGYARAISGLTLLPLYTWGGAAPDERLGWSVAGVGDWNRDGRDDVLLGAPFATAGGMAGSGRIEVRSGADGSSLGSFGGFAVGEQFGYALAATGDVDGDGFGDCLVGAPGASPHGMIDGGRIYLLSRTGGILLTLDGTTPGERFGQAVAGAGDVDRDGVFDLLAGSPKADPAGIADAGAARLISGRTGADIARFEGSVAGEQLGSAVAAGGDFSADSIRDLLVGAPFSLFPNYGRGIAYGVAPFLDASTDALSAAGGGAVTLALQFPDEFRSGDFRVLASLAGPGRTRLGGLDVPIVADELFGRTLLGHYPAGAINFAGILSDRAEAGALFVAAPGALPASWIGRSVAFAAVARGLGGDLASSVHRQLHFLP